MTTPTPAGPPDRLEAGAILSDRYEIVRRLGMGGMGAVYLGRHRQMERLCAIKVLHPSLSGDPEAMERFTREARNASRIAHQNVCTIYDFGTTPEGLAYLAMEYVEGRTLGSILAERGRLPLRRAAALARQIAAGLDAAHAIGIVHRDLKPDNVMIATAGPVERVKLVDFGIAKALAHDIRRDVTAPGVVVGTPDYMAPEQFAGDPPDPRNDLYSLALIFYRAVTGAMAFTGATARETLTRRLTEPARPLHAAAPQVAFPEGLQTVMDRALARRPEDRFPTATDFADALDEVLSTLPPDESGSTETVRLDAPTAVFPGARTGWNRWVPYLVVSAVALVGLGLAVRFITRTAGPAPSPPASSAAPAPSPPLRDSGAVAERPPVKSAIRPAPPDVRAAAPVLPTPEEVFTPGTRDASRTRAEQIYGRPEADPALRAQAAMIVATVAGEQGRFAEAEAWATRAVAANDSAAPGAERVARAERYQNFLNQIRLKRKGSPTP